MNAATLDEIIDETADLKEQVRSLHLDDGQHTIGSYKGVAIAARVENGKVVEYIANDSALNQPPPQHAHS
jgi:predicted Zn-dependent protease with MMP-like domain